MAVLGTHVILVLTCLTLMQGSSSLSSKLLQLEELHSVSGDIYKYARSAIDDSIDNTVGELESDALRDLRHVGFIYHSHITDGQTDGNISSQCLIDTVQFIRDLGQKYTQQVLDSVGKIPAGVLRGHVMWMGSYEECTDTVTYLDTTNTTQQFTGQYCTATFTSSALVLPESGISVGLCVPSSCNDTSVQLLLNAVLSTVGVELNSSSVICAAKPPFVTGDIVASVIIGVLILMVILGSLVDITVRSCSQQEKHTPRRPYTDDLNATLLYNDDLDMQHESETFDAVTGRRSTPRDLLNEQVTHSKTRSSCSGGLLAMLQCFSVFLNGEKILTPHQRSGGLDCLNGLRVVSMWWVILGHTYLYSITFLENPLKLLELKQRFTFLVIINGTFSVDSFFFLSGLLVAYLTLQEMKRQDGKINWIYFYAHRFWRLTPLYMMVMMVFTTLFLHIPEGPFMSSIDDTISVRICYDYWWTNLLYINNYYPGDAAKECMNWGWYLANDMQFYILSPIFLVLLHNIRWRRWGISLLVLVSLASILGTGAWTAYYQLSVLEPTGIPNQRNETNPAANYEMYERSYHRIPVYLVGILTGYLLYRTDCKLKLTKFAVVVGWSCAIAINMSVLYGLYEPYHQRHLLDLSLAAFYAAVSRFAWSLGLAWVVVACVTGYGGPVNTFLSWSVWVPLSRLTYAAYLVHPIVILTYYLSLKQLIHYSDFTMVYLYVGHVVLSYMAALGVSLAIEGPMMSLEKWIMATRRHKGNMQN